MSGWIKLSRDLLNAGTYRQTPFDQTHAWIDMLLLARYEDGYTIFRGNRIETPRGCFITSVRDLAKRWGWSKDRVQRYLDVCILDEQIKLKTSRLCSIIRITNYEKYQDSSRDAKQDAGKDTGQDTGKDSKSGTNQASAKDSSKGIGTDTARDAKPDARQDTIERSKEIKNSKRKNTKKEKVSFLGVVSFPASLKKLSFAKTWRKWEAHRKQIRHPLTEIAVRQQLKMLSRFPIPEAVEIIEASIRNSWQGLFPLKSRPETRRNAGKDHTGI